MQERYRDLGEAVCARLALEVRKLGFADGQIPAISPRYQAAQFETERDPYTGTETLCAYWYKPEGGKIGELKFHGDGSFYAEYDVILPHPSDSRWFVEGVIAWGRGDLIKAEPKLLPALGD